MQIYLLRHGIAEEGSPGSSDSERALTGEGKRKLREVLRVARAADVRPTLILTSPYRRAVETARIAAEVLECKEDLVKVPVLVPNGRPEQVWDEIRQHKREEQLLIAGHEPLLGYTTAYLLGVPSLMLDFKKAMLVRIDIEQFPPQPHGLLKWVFGPSIASCC